MLPNVHVIVLSRSQGACLSALRLGKSSLGQIAITAALSIKKTNRVLSDLESFGLADRSRSPENGMARNASRKDVPVRSRWPTRTAGGQPRAIPERSPIARIAGASD